ncbi:putative f-box domain protein [Phaeomoniella chlamydospora]|uniref:Putative f-box domain protein n=1 Tax=Phaeomoniella chlamydospora TaxID=158046 RepID=A0A0G2EH23_PHACM|nr:putative f-box domain protein [Phaeomoniella chlamydospora]
MVAAMASPLESLPNEILTEILSSFSITSLLPLLTVSQSLHTLALRVLHRRIVSMWPLPSHGLILEAYHPSHRWTEPYLLCSFLGLTGGLSKSAPYESLYCDSRDYAERCAKLREVYSRFRPHKRGNESTRRLPIVGDLDGNNLPAGDVRTSNAIGAEQPQEKVEHVVNLDSDELFSQLCLSSSLVKLGPISGVFPSAFEAAGGVIRVWRDWLQRQAESLNRAERRGLLDEEEGEAEMMNNILWVDWRHDVGLKVRVRERPWPERVQAPGMEGIAQTDDRPVSYAIEIQELFIRTSHLVQAVEGSLDEQKNRSEKYELDPSAEAIAAGLRYGHPVYREKKEITALVKDDLPAATATTTEVYTGNAEDERGEGYDDKDEM